jgi:hypothetical protein
MVTKYLLPFLGILVKIPGLSIKNNNAGRIDEINECIIYNINKILII